MYSDRDLYESKRPSGRLLNDYDLGYKPKKGNNMNTQVQNPEAVKANPEAEAFLAKMVKKLEKDGEVLVQTDADAGVETPATQTVH